MAGIDPYNVLPRWLKAKWQEATKDADAVLAEARTRDLAPLRHAINSSLESLADQRDHSPPHEHHWIDQERAWLEELLRKLA